MAMPGHASEPVDGIEIKGKRFVKLDAARSPDSA